MSIFKAIKAYRAHTKSGWAACNKLGHTWPISAEEAGELPKVKTFSEIEAAYGL